MPAEPSLGELAALVIELRAMAQDLRATAARIASASAQEGPGELSERELARRTRPELERAERRGIGGGGGIEGSGSWHRR